MTEQWGDTTPEAPRKKRRWVKGAVIATIIILFMFSCTAIVASTSVNSNKPLTTTADEPLPTWAKNLAKAPAPKDPADVTMESTCEYLLDFDNGHLFVASAFLSNDGGTAATVKVTATWRQSGGRAVTSSKNVKVPAGAEDVEVQFSKKASNTQIDKIQAVATDKQCKVTGK